MRRHVRGKVGEECHRPDSDKYPITLIIIHDKDSLDAWKTLVAGQQLPVVTRRIEAHLGRQRH